MVEAKRKSPLFLQSLVEAGFFSAKSAVETPPDKQSGSSPSTVETTGKTQSSAFLGQKAFKGQPYALPLFVVELKVHLKLY
jgi:hypothetical protein